LEKRRLRHAKKLFELAITLLKSFSNFGRIHKEKKSVKDNKEGNCPQNNNNPKVTQEQLREKNENKVREKVYYLLRKFVRLQISFKTPV
jgi:hypothetical protein